MLRGTTHPPPPQPQQARTDILLQAENSPQSRQHREAQPLELPASQAANPSTPRPEQLPRQARGNAQQGLAARSSRAARNHSEHASQQATL
ncbi:hypothetical protein N7486_005532 [Penicillium sp. IBT 16267x]|nr:hypothetical protein N7486_005532 [Penicillium sp. IBT 16267x]